MNNDDFKQSIAKFYANKKLSAIDQLKATPPYPTPHVLAQFASMAFSDCKHGDNTTPDGWQLLTTASNFRNGYFGTAYWHSEHQQVVIAHRGTETKSAFAFLIDLCTDIRGVARNKYAEKVNSASTFANKVVAALQEIEQEQKVSFEIFFTGSSLGGWLAQITTFTTEYLEVKSGTFLKKQKEQQGEDDASSPVQDSYDVTHNYHPHTVVFESPGCKDMLSLMADKLDVRQHGSSIDLQHLDITSYLSAPNLINTCNSHLGTVYRIFTDLCIMDWKEKFTPMYNLATQSTDKIQQAFDPETEKVYKDDTDRLKILEVVDWPVSSGLTGAELNDFLKWAEHLYDYHPDVMNAVPNEVPKGYHQLRYQTKAYEDCTIYLSIFTQDQQEFLEHYYSFRNMPEFFQPKELFSVMNNVEAQKEAEQKLRVFELDNKKFRCPDASTLNALIPYVKRLVRLLPHIKEKLKDQLSSSRKRNNV